MGSGYPEAYGCSQRRRDRWFESYIESVVVRDLRARADIRKIEEIPSLLRLIAARGDRFVAGVVIYPGGETKALTEKIWAVPVSALWGADDPLVTKILSPSSPVAVHDRRRATGRRGL